MLIKIIATPKKDILDPQGKTVGQTLVNLGYPEVKDVRIGKYILLKTDNNLSRREALQRVKKMCEKFLVNPIIEDYQFEIEEKS